MAGHLKAAVGMKPPDGIGGNTNGKRRIAIIAGQLVVGGAERQLYLWLSNMDRDRFDPIVITLKGQPGDFWEEPIRKLGIPLLRETHNSNRPLRLWALTRMLRAWRPDLIHGWHLFASLYAGATAKMLGAVGLGSLRSSAESFEGKFWQSALSERLLDAMLINSASAAARLRADGRCRRQRVFIVQNGVELVSKDRDEVRRTLVPGLDLTENVTWIGMMARMVPHKGFELILDVVGALRAGGQEVGLVLIGDGPLRSQLEEQAERLKIRDAVRFVGEDPSARSWLSALDVYCCLTYSEGLPNVLLEASAAGLPVVGWRASFAEEVLSTSADAGLVRMGDVDELKVVLRRLIGDRTERRALGLRARDHVEATFGLPRFVNGLTAVYNELLQQA